MTSRINELKTNIERLKETIRKNCWNEGYVINTTRTLNAYEQELATLTA
jgi:hypothetical protein